MKTLESIFKRRSIRKYTDKPISEEQLTALLRAAMAAPTARNCQEWEFIVVRSQDTLKKIMTIHPYAQMLKDADCAIIVCGNLEREHASGYWIADCGAATQNILLAATDMGLGAVWLGVFPNEERILGLRKLFKLPDNIMPLNVISLGYPAEQPDEVDRFDPAKVHYEQW